MTPVRVLVVVLAISLVACDAGRSTSTPDRSAAATVGELTSGMEFSGERDCVDCDGIEAWLRLEQVGEIRRYRMVELYYGQAHDRRFEDSGEWSADGELLRLRSSEGGERVYARAQGGYLQARGAHGQRIPAVEDDVLAPAGFDSTR